MQTYLVGGAVRDKLLGLGVADRDFVVVGATPDEMRALGYRPVGKDFPVFLRWRGPSARPDAAITRSRSTSIRR
jgi:tRNA nucleotidyltransferase (CCA-adding enzyme)